MRKALWSAAAAAALEADRKLAINYIRDYFFAGFNGAS